MENSQNNQGGQFGSIVINQHEAGYTEEFDVCDTISVRCGNVCRIEVIDGVNESGKGHVRVVGDPVFLRYFALEYISGQREPDGLLINIKNPTGSAVSWKPYDRQGYTGENFVQIFTGRFIIDVQVNVYHYLDLNAVNGINPQGNHEFVYYTDGYKVPIYLEGDRIRQDKVKRVIENTSPFKTN